MHENIPTPAEDVPIHEFKLYKDEAYFQAVNTAIASTGAGDRIAVSTMKLEPNEPIVVEILDNLLAAADRDAHVLFAIDYMTMNDAYTIGPVATPWLRRPQLYTERKLVISQFQQHRNIDCALINQPGKNFSNHFARRSHFKSVIINDQVFLAGANLDLTDRLDMAVAFDDQRTADWLYEMTRAIIEAREIAPVLGKADLVFPVDTDSSLLIDVGIPGQSLTLEQGLQLINEAEEQIVFTCQYFPSGVTGKHLRAAHRRGTNVEVTYNHPDTHPNMNLIHKALLTKGRLTYPPEFFARILPPHVPLHTKGLVTEQAGMLGNHNMLDIGVKLGTAEITLLSKNAVFVQALRTLLREQVELAMIYTTT